VVLNPRAGRAWRHLNVGFAVLSFLGDSPIDGEKKPAGDGGEEISAGETK